MNSDKRRHIQNQHGLVMYCTIKDVQYTIEDIDAAEIARRRAIYVPLTEAVRDLIDATIRTEVDDTVIAQARDTIADATAKLRTKQMPGSYGLRKTRVGDSVSWGNVAVGLRNAIAPPILIESSPDGLHWAELTLGAAYEGPTGLVHGGMGALILDHVLGATAKSVAPSFTGTLTLRYRRGTPLGTLRAEARVDRTEGRKVIVTGTLSDADGITIEAEGIFIRPVTS